MLAQFLANRAEVLEPLKFTVNLLEILRALLSFAAKTRQQKVAQLRRGPITQWDKPIGRKVFCRPPFSTHWQKGSLRATSRRH